MPHNTVLLDRAAQDLYLTRILNNLRKISRQLRTLQVEPGPHYRARFPSERSQRDSLRYHYWFSNSH